MGLKVTPGMRWDQVSEIMFGGDPSHIFEIIEENIDAVRAMIQECDVITEEIELEVPTISEASKADVNLPPWRRASA